MSRDDEIASRAGSRGARSTVRSAGHTASGGHSLLKNRISHEPNALPPDFKRHHMPQHTDYPRWVHFEGKPSVVAQTPEEEAALIEADKPAPRRGRPPKTEAVETAPEPAAE